MKTVTAKQARQNFSEILNEVYYGDKKVLITRSGKPIVILTSAKPQRKKN
ncbi:MAG: type II toxin-antitoxin system Phd/YefM family antitoxin [Candidatus Levybacteria bacterium]|nr:type II toxin-antitoxin system Phd/YefM family antitoxin [Candidatus Levybacteria bacterium]